MNEQATSELALTEIRHVVVACLQRVLADRGRPAEVPVGPTTRLLGRDAVLDSLGLVTLIVDVEDTLRSAHGLAITLTGERAMSQASSPFMTVDSLAEYIAGLTRDDN